jgi:hypothetical protein
MKQAVLRHNEAAMFSGATFYTLWQEIDFGEVT